MSQQQEGDEAQYDCDEGQNEETGRTGLDRCERYKHKPGVVPQQRYEKKNKKKTHLFLKKGSNRCSQKETIRWLTVKLGRGA